MVRHREESRRSAAELFESGMGYRSVSRRLGISMYTARRWWRLYKSLGSADLMSSGETQRRYPFDLKVSAASAVVDGGEPKSQVMARFGVASDYTLQRWCNLYRAGGAEALRPRPKGRPRNDG